MRGVSAPVRIGGPPMIRWDILVCFAVYAGPTLMGTASASVPHVIDTPQEVRVCQPRMYEDRRTTTRGV